MLSEPARSIEHRVEGCFFTAWLVSGRESPPGQFRGSSPSLNFSTVSSFGMLFISTYVSLLDP